MALDQKVLMQRESLKVLLRSGDLRRGWQREFVMRLPNRIVNAMPKKQNRCWPGYEPVSGKQPHEQGSCRPKAESKLAPSEKDFGKKRRAQLNKWEAEHPGKSRSGARHISAPQSNKKKSTRRAKQGATMN
jgi:hypothetical protein